MLRVRFSLRSIVLLAIACGAGYGLWQRWDAWTERFVLKGDGRYLFQLQLTDDGQRILTCPSYEVPDENGLMKPVPREAWIWRADTGLRERVISWLGSESAGYSQTEMLCGGKWIRFRQSAATGVSPRGSVERIFSSETGEDPLSAISKSVIVKTLCDPQEQYLLVEFAEPRAPVVLCLKEGGRIVDLGEAPTGKLMAAFSTEGRYLIVLGNLSSKEPQYSAYDLGSGELLQRKKVEWWVGSAPFDPDGLKIVVRGLPDPETGNGTAEIWDWKSGQCLGRIKSIFDEYPEFVARDRILFFHSWNQTSSLYDASDLKLLAKLKGEWGRGYSVSRSRSGRQFVTWELSSATGGESQGAAALLDPGYRFFVWDSATGNPVSQVLVPGLVAGPGPSHVRFSFDDRWIFHSCGKRTWIWLAETGGALRSFDGRATLLRDNVRYVELGNEGNVTINDLESGDLLFNLVSSASQAAEIQGTQDGRRLYIADKGGDVHCFYRRRPEHWWGIAWLPELWVALVVAPVLLWSLWRDFKTLRKAKGAAEAVS